MVVSATEEGPPFTRGRGGPLPWLVHSPDALVLAVLQKLVAGFIRLTALFASRSQALQTLGEHNDGDRCPTRLAANGAL